VKPPAWLLPLVLTVAALAAVFAFLRPAPSVSTVGGMSSTLTKPRAKKPARRVVAKPAARRQTRAEFVAEIKGIAARIDSGEEKTIPAKEVWRELGI
jgi:hypothetical protein